MKQKALAATTRTVEESLPLAGGEGSSLDSHSGAPTTVRFARFELNLETGELRQDGIAIRPQPQPTLILTLLVSRPGTLVTREEIQQRIWGTETFIDFDTGLNSAIRQIRHALKDDTEAPRFIETVPRRGYRFLAPLEKIENNGTAPAVLSPGRSDTVPAIKPRSWWHAKWLLAGGGVVLAALLVVAIWLAMFRAHGEAIDSVAVLPFVNASSDLDTEYLSDGITETLIRQLSQIPRLRVMARSTVFRYKGSKIDPQKSRPRSQCPYGSDRQSPAARRNVDYQHGIDGRQGWLPIVGQTIQPQAHGHSCHAGRYRP